MSNILSQNAFWIINKDIAREIGLDATLLLSDLITKEEYFNTPNRWFFNTSQNIETDTTLSYHKQKIALKILIDREFIETRLIGVPAKLYFKTFENKISNFLNTSILKSRELFNKNKENKNKDNIIEPSLPLKKEINIENTSIEEKMAYDWTLWLKERFSKRHFNKEDLKVDKTAIKKMSIAIEKKISIEQLKEATENASMNDYHIKDKFEKIRQPQWMLQQRRDDNYKIINEFNVEHWLKKSQPKEIDGLKEIFKDLWKETFGYYENNIDFEWEQLTEDERYDATEKIQEYKESVPLDEIKYLKRPKGYLSSKVFKSDFAKDNLTGSPANKEIQTFYSIICQHIKDKKNLQIFQRLGQTYSLQAKDITIENISFLESILVDRMKEVMKKVKAEENNKNETEFRMGEVAERLNTSPIITKENEARAIEILFEYIKKTSESGYDTGRYGSQISGEWISKVTKPH